MTGETFGTMLTVVREIRRRVAAGEMQKTLAAEFGISDVLVSQIVRRKAWAHVD